MTVASVILAGQWASALADADGLPAARRIAESAWSGGAIPVVVVSPDPVGALALALAGTEAAVVEPDPLPGGLAGSASRGIEAAIELVGETDAALVWPAGMTWPDPETITSLIEAHGTDPQPLLRPEFGGQPGWPILVPVDRLEQLRGLSPDLSAEQLIEALSVGRATIRLLDLGDPGTIHPVTIPRASLPPYRGPAEPASGHAHEWGETGLADDQPGRD